MTANVVGHLHTGPGDSLLNLQASNIVLSTPAGHVGSLAGCVGCVLLVVYWKNTFVEKMWLLWHKLKE